MNAPLPAISGLRVIMGPTGAGKSALAMGLAERYGLAIISADSRQVYKGFDVGTAKPTDAERARVAHFGVDVLEPTVRYSAHQWAIDAAGWIDDALARGKRPVVVGGTGFYVRALVSPLDPVAPVDASSRASLERWLENLSPEELRRWCARLDPARGHFGRTQQLRAVETALLAGHRLSDTFLAHAGDPVGAITRASMTRYLVVDPGPLLAARIADRVGEMLKSGWVSEIRSLLQHVPLDAPAWGASGYRVMRDAIAAGNEINAATARVVIETRQYAKRQRTWCRHQLPPGQVTHIDSSAADALVRACAWWESDNEIRT